MHAQQLVAGLLALAPAFVSAAPAISSRTASKNFTLSVHVPNPVHKDSHSNFEGLVLNNFHIGAGEGAIAGYNDSQTGVAQINETQLVWYLNGSEFPYHQYQYGVLDTQYTSWLAPSIQTGTPTTGSFFINETGLQWSTGNTSAFEPAGDGFGGWIMCDWWYSRPELFWVLRYSNGVLAGGLTSNCESVQLIPNYLPETYS